MTSRDFQPFTMEICDVKRHVGPGSHVPRAIFSIRLTYTAILSPNAEMPDTLQLTLFECVAYRRESDGELQLKFGYGGQVCKFSATMQRYIKTALLKAPSIIAALNPTIRDYLPYRAKSVNHAQQI